MATRAVVLSGPSPIVRDHTPTTALDAGEIVVIAGVVGLCMSEIKANKTGSLLLGNQTVRAKLASIKASTSFTDHDKVYWDSTNEEFTTASGDGDYCGLADGTGSDTAGLDILWNYPEPA
tara:strand:- start:549 stop:908 length:360 start_codon:yes stop_codon:yes gene_type:complete